jgi:hypothetical protein
MDTCTLFLGIAVIPAKAKFLLGNASYVATNSSHHFYCIDGGCREHW